MTVQRMFSSTKGMEGKPSQELCDMLKYMKKTAEDNVINQDIVISVCEFFENVL